MDPNKKASNVYSGGTNNEHGKRTSKNGKQKRQINKTK